VILLPDPFASNEIYTELVSSSTRYFSSYKERALAVHPRRFPERIFITRINCKCTLVNIAQVEEVLKSKGFVTYIMDELSFFDQSLLFYQASYIVAIHGASLRNLFFANSCSTLEICPSGFGSNCFNRLAAHLNLDFETFYGSEISHNRRQNFFCDLDSFSSTLKDFLNR